MPRKAAWQSKTLFSGIFDSRSKIWFDEGTVNCRFAKVKFAHILMAIIACGMLGCTSSYRFVLVSVVDSKTGKPVEGAKVSIHFHPSTQTFTGHDGMALLKLPLKDAQDAIFDVQIVNQQYDENFGESESDGEWMQRDKGVVPTTPDIVLEVESRIDRRHEEEAEEEEIDSAKRAAEQLNRESPDYWPERTNRVAEMLFSLRWEQASKNTLGSPGDIDSIRSVVIRHMGNPKATVDEIRWISPTVVMVRSSWYSGPLAAGTCTYVLRKNNAGWVVVTYALDAVS